MPTLPNFSIVIDDVLAASAHPRHAAHDAESLRAVMTEFGVGAIISLDEYGLPRDQVAEAGLKYLHLQILDFHPPCLEQIDEFIAFIDECKEAGTLALVHCFAGMGRTGTMLACYLGRDQPELTADQAIAQIRKMRPGSIETLSQEDVIHAYFKTRKKN